MIPYTLEEYGPLPGTLPADTESPKNANASEELCCIWRLIYIDMCVCN